MNSTATSRVPSIGMMRSKFEKMTARTLHSKGVTYEYETYQLPYVEPLRKNKAYCASCNGTDLLRMGWYTPDFYLPSTDLFIETKGRFTAADRRKMLAVREDNPDDRIVMLFMRDNKIHKRSKTHYSDWCMANGYEFAIGEPLEEWL